MTISNSHLAKNIDGSALKIEDIRLGLKITAPSPAGGVLTFKCTSLNDCKATFNSTNKEWPVELDMKFNQNEFDLKAFESLYVTMNNFNKSSNLVTTNQRQLISRATELGYVNQRSYTQANWTTFGIEAYNSTKACAKDILVNGYTIRFNPLWNKWQASHDVAGSEEFATQSEAIIYANKG